jgi:predicted dehydrogenase
MGLRHLHGLKALLEVAEKLPIPQVQIALLAVADSNLDNAFYIAEESHKLLGIKPQVYSSQAQMLAAQPQIEAVDITTGTSSHHSLVVEALEAGRHVLVEKPLAASILGCNLALAAAEKSGKVLAVAENVRRDPMNRLARALLQDGAIGTPYLAVEHIATGGSAILLTPWRHRKETGGILLDVAVHNADVMRYLLGKVESVAGHSRLLEKVRYRSHETAVVSEAFYQRWLVNLPEEIETTADDLLVGHFNFESGATGQWTILQAAHGYKRTERLIYGSKGMLELPPDRSGKAIILHREDLNSPISEEELLPYAPSYKLDSLTAALMGSETPLSYSLSFEEIDRILVAVEIMDFAEAVAFNRSPEVDGSIGREDVALVYGLIESGVCGCSLSLDDIIQKPNLTYQQEINRLLGIEQP